MRKKTVAALLVAAGRGERAGQTDEGPKQFRRIGGRPVLWHTIRAFAGARLVSRVIVVIHPDDEDRALAAVSDFSAHVEFVIGGTTRQASVRAGLLALQSAPPDIVLIHDAVRPFVEPGLIEAVIDTVDEAAGALPAIAVSDTLKRVERGTIEGTVDRTGLFAAQTPQGFTFQAILAAHDRAARDGGSTFTDDASIAEWAGYAVRIVPGSVDNVKLTLARDLVLADEKLSRGASMIDVRTGNGYDVHQLVPGDHVTLCGVRIAHDMALLGHSDADVGLHALTDAILATCGAGDIGEHFPPSDPQWKGAASHVFVRHAVQTVSKRGGRICNVDVTLICEAPKISPHREAMVIAIADMTGLDAERVSVKATTNEAIGFIGRREGIAAIATSSIVYGA